MTLRQALSQARKQLSLYQFVEDAAFESEVLLRYVLQIGRAQLFLQLEEELEPSKGQIFRQWVERRSRGEPVSYIIGCREFFGLEFYVDSRVLIPRPESELLVEEALHFALDHPVGTIADIGTGSGAIAISLATYLPEAKIYATDISPAALEVADINCRKHHVAGRVVLLQGDLLEPLPEAVDILIANLPYVRRVDLAQMPSGRYEPALALDGGESGLERLAQLCRQIEGKVRPGGGAWLEIGQGQGGAVSDCLRKAFPAAIPEILPDLAGIERVVKIRI
ncbi:MAG: N5-glutamine S-adenosyl-L-methionine-dependent methyltransferase [Chloroflexi bacterium]|nr:N5-glutamine S-adenosyl-L-methionine-dependent methyltransferase [Chloroflexota bacterium]